MFLYSTSLLWVWCCLFHGLRLYSSASVGATSILDYSDRNSECVFPCLYSLKLSNIGKVKDILSTLRIHSRQNVIDAASDYVWRNSLDMSAGTAEILHTHICSEPTMKDRIECQATKPNLLVSFMEATPPPLRCKYHRLSVRNGYTAVDTVRFYCLQVGCAEDMASYLIEQTLIELNTGDKTELLQRRFSKTYEYKVWEGYELGEHGVESGGGSGPGSGRVVTRVIKEELPGKIFEFCVHV